jgi:hypothetical protein
MEIYCLRTVYFTILFAASKGRIMALQVVLMGMHRVIDDTKIFLCFCDWMSDTSLLYCSLLRFLPANATGSTLVWAPWYGSHTDCTEYFY